MIERKCPQCGATLAFRTSICLLAVCSYCRSLVARKDLDVERLGEVAQLQSDGTPLRVGARGAFAGADFEVVGRVQLSTGAGFWNEWNLAYADGRQGWLGEAQGTYALSFSARCPAVPAFETLKVGATLSLGGKSYRVRDLLRAKYLSAEGELPFRPPLGGEAPSADLISPGGFFGTLDWSDGPAQPLLFLGRYVEFDALGLTGLRAFEGVGDAGRGRCGRMKLDCPQCGGTLTLRAEGVTRTLACQYCGAPLDARDPRLPLIGKYFSKVEPPPTLPLGARGRLRGEELEIIGYQRKRVRYSGVDYDWGEYLLWNPYRGLRWLVESNGHWLLARTLSDDPGQEP